MASRRNGTLYVGVTNNLLRRVWEHKNNKIDGFTKKYHVHMLVWFSEYENILQAISREKQLKEWNRTWKLELVEKDNPDWMDLYEKYL
jgi:putative endonuclease